MFSTLKYLGAEDMTTETLTEKKTRERYEVRVSTSEQVKTHFDELVESSGKSRAELLDEMIETYKQFGKSDKPTAKNLTADLDNTKKLNFFKHLTKNYLKGKEYLTSLSEQRYTLKQLVETAIVASGKSQQQFLESALIAQSKMELSLKARKDSLDEDPRSVALLQALKELNQEIADGTYKPQLGKLGLTPIANRAAQIMGKDSINFSYAKEWQKRNSTLFPDQAIEVTNDSEAYDQEVSA